MSYGHGSELMERGDRIDAALDRAFQDGQDSYSRNKSMAAEAALYDFANPKLFEAFCEGWADAAEDDAS